MKISILFVVVCAVLTFSALHAIAQDTFSIVAVDTVTGQVGSAGGSCLSETDIHGGVSIIGDLIIGKGAINTQAFWRPENQVNARWRMEEGDTPQQIITWLRENDIDGDSTIRQYGIAAFDGNGKPVVTAWTGSGCNDYKSHIVGRNYSIQGNILLGQMILDSMEARFLRSPGTLADKLMEALQGAKVPGADTRCAGEGISCQSAFIRVADKTTKFLDIVVAKTPFGHEPIDSLQILYSAWKTSGSVDMPSLPVNAVHVDINASTHQIVLRIDYNVFRSGMTVHIYDAVGKSKYTAPVSSATTAIDLNDVPSGVFWITLSTDSGVLYRKSLAIAK